MRGPSMRVQLVGLVAVIALPLVAASAWIAWRQYETHREALGATLLGVSRALSVAADRELATGLALVQTLAHSPLLDEGRLREFHQLASRVAAMRDDAWMLLIEPSGQIVMHTRRPFGASLPNSFELEPPLAADSDELPRSGARWLRKVFETGTPVFSDLFHGQISGSFVVAAAVPVLREGSVRYVLTIVMPASVFQPLVAGRPNVEGAGAVLFDSRGFIIARAVQPEQFVGKRVPPDVLRSVRDAPESVARGRSVQGVAFFRAVTRSPVSGWTAGVSLTEEAAFGAIWRSMRDSAAVAGFILVLGIALALWMGRTVARRRALEAETRAKDEFLAALSHELRNPLSGIALSAELLRRAVPGNRTVEEVVDRVARQVEQLRRLLDDLLDTTRATHGKLNLQARAVDLRECAARLTQDYLRRPGLSAAIEVLGEEIHVQADPARLHQMIDNLVENAVKYGARRIRLEVRARNGFGVLSVTDDGQGIAPELLERLFQPFVQGEQTLERPQGGLGLGLALVRRLAEAQGGAIEARSDGRGRGSTFTLRLPLADPAAAEAVCAVEPGAARRRVLVVEDLEDARESLRRLLESEGHLVAVAGDGPQALAMLRSFRPEVALIDIGLPGMNGYRLAREARATLDRRITLIALTGYGQAEDRKAALDAGFDLHLTKPVSFDELRKALALGTEAAPGKYNPEP